MTSLWLYRGYVSRKALLPSSGSEWSWLLSIWGVGLENHGTRAVESQSGPQGSLSKGAPYPWATPSYPLLKRGIPYFLLAPGNYPGYPLLSTVLPGTNKEIAIHWSFGRCETSKDRRWLVSEQQKCRLLSSEVGRYLCHCSIPVFINWLINWDIIPVHGMCLGPMVIS